MNPVTPQQYGYNPYQYGYYSQQNPASGQAQAQAQPQAAEAPALSNTITANENPQDVASLASEVDVQDDSAGKKGGITGLLKKGLALAVGLFTAVKVIKKVLNAVSKPAPEGSESAEAININSTEAAEE